MYPASVRRVQERTTLLHFSPCGEKRPTDGRTPGPVVKLHNFLVIITVISGEAGQGMQQILKDGKRPKQNPSKSTSTKSVDTCGKSRTQASVG